MAVKRVKPPKRRKLSPRVEDETSEQSKDDEALADVAHSPKQAPKATATEKGKEKVGTSSFPHLSRSDLFGCHEALARHPAFAGKIGQAPKGFHESALNAHPQFRRVIESLGWELLCVVQNQYNVDWVIDFYTELGVTNGVELLVWHATVNYSVTAINEILGLHPPEYSEFNRLVNNATSEDLQVVLSRIAHEGSEWSFKGNSRCLRTHCLKPEANVWFFFLRHTLYPTSHDTSLCMPRVFILYCIMEGHKFDDLQEHTRRCR